MAATSTDRKREASRHRAKRLLLLSFAVAILAVSVGIWLLTSYAPTPRQAKAPPAFVLHTTDGRRFDSAAPTGHPYAMFFGFTHCPIVCPTSLNDISLWLNELGKEAKDFRFYFVSLDPERDTPEKLKTYLESFSAPITGLTGSEAEIATAAKAMSVYYRKVPTSSGYTLDHTALFFLFDAQGRQRGVLNYDADKTLALSRLRALINEK